MIEKKYEDHRCLLTHNAAMSLRVGLSIGEGETNVIERRDDKLYLNLEPFLNITMEVVKKILDDSEIIVNSSEQLKRILSK